MIELAKKCLHSKGKKRPAIAAIARKVTGLCETHTCLPHQFAVPGVEQGAEEAEEENCTVCYDNPRTHAFIPCGHLCVCGDCAERGEFSRCIMCRVPASSLQRIYS